MMKCCRESNTMPHLAKLAQAHTHTHIVQLPIDPRRKIDLRLRKQFCWFWDVSFRVGPKMIEIYTQLQLLSEFSQATLHCPPHVNMVNIMGRNDCCTFSVRTKLYWLVAKNIPCVFCFFFFKIILIHFECSFDVVNFFLHFFSIGGFFFFG